MAKKLRVGDAIHGYRVTKVIGSGMMAISYGAESASGERVFLKQYKSPSPAIVWYAPFVAYQRELARRVRDGKAAHFAVRLIETFEERWGGPTYFAAYEFVENGRDLEHLLDEERETHRRTAVAPAADQAVWARHVTWAKVFMAGIAALHDARIVHADLKPANAYLLKDDALGSGYQLKLIDMDFSVLTDRRAPWHGHQGYVGTDNYRSPEHLTRGAVPIPASDVFTCGLILCELLTGVHPYWHEEQAEYARRVRAYDVAPPALLGVMPGPASNGVVSTMLHRCLAPDPALRPSAVAVRAVLAGRGGEAVAAARRPTTSAAPTAIAAAPTSMAAAPTASAAASGAALTSSRILLVSPGGAALRIGVRTPIGKAVLRAFGPEAEFWDVTQCTIERRADGQWMVTPAPATVNETLVNGAPLTTGRALRDGDVIAAGRSATGISKLPLTAHDA